MNGLSPPPCDAELVTLAEDAPPPSHASDSGCSSRDGAEPADDVRDTLPPVATSGTARRGVCACRRSRLLAATPVNRAGELLERAMELALRDMLLARAYLKQISEEYDRL